MAENIISVPISAIVEIDDVPDRELDADYVAALVATNEPEKWPPIIVTPLGDKFGRIAGKHRIAAASKLQLITLPTIVRLYECKEEMYFDMWNDNVRNGLPLTTKQRKEYAVNLHNLLPRLSLREIGRHTGLPHQTVKRAIRQWEKEADTDEHQTAYNRAMTDHSKRLITSLNQFFDNERAMIGASDGKRSETARAKALACKMSASEHNIKLMLSLARTFNETAAILTSYQEA